MRLYTVNLAPDEKTWTKNQQLSDLKQQYDEYLIEQAIVPEDRVIKLLATGRVRSVNYIGVLEGE